MRRRYAPRIRHSASRPTLPHSSRICLAGSADAHFVLSRSGASTVSEIAAIGRPAILVPFPHALDHDQAANAAALQAAGGADVIKQSELSPERIAAILTSAMNEPDTTGICCGKSPQHRQAGRYKVACGPRRGYCVRPAY